MKKSMKYVTISIVMIFAVLFFTMARSFASGIQILRNGNGVSNRAENTNTRGNTATNTNRNNQAVNSPEAKENIVQVNQINDAEKDIPKTGETDIYIVAGIAVIAVAVGTFAFIKSRKYNV